LIKIKSKIELEQDRFKKDAKTKLHSVIKMMPKRQYFGERGNPRIFKQIDFARHNIHNKLGI
jgi:hypothetical protein